MKKLILTLSVIVASLFSFAQNNFEELIDVKQYTINLDISDFSGKTISGNTIVNLQTTSENISTIYLYLQNLTVDSIVCSDYEISSFSHNDTIITVNFESSPSANLPFDLNIYYHGAPQTDPSGWGGFYFSGNYAFNMGCGFDDVPHNYGRVWFPCNDNFTDKAKYTTIITTQSENTAISSGELVETTIDEETGKTTYKWVMNQEIPTYLQSVAVGEYYHYHSVYQGIEREIPIDIYGYPTDSAKIVSSFSRLDTTMQVFEEHFGAYPWQRIGFVLVNFSSGAMEHACNISLGRIFVTAGSYETLYYHELSHQWFGDLVTCASAEEMWLNEGFATYCETLWTEFVLGKDEAKKYRRSVHSDVLTKIHISDGEYLPLSPNPVYNTYSSNVYDKGASTVHALRGYLGDSLFFETIKAYLEEFAYSTATSEQFRDFITEYTDIDMTAFFDSWIFEKGYLHYAIDSAKVVQNNENYDITVYVRQKLLQRENFSDANRVEITFMKPDFSTETRMMQFDGEYGEQTFRLPFNPALIMCDYFEKTSDATIEQTQFLTEVDNETFSLASCGLRISQISDTAFFRVTCNYVTPDDFTEPIEGLSLVPSRYWLVEGIFPEDFEAQLDIIFNSYGSGWENSFLETSQLDSLTLVYRPNKSENWQVVPARYYTGSQKFRTETFATGEYAIAIKNGYNKISDFNSDSFSVFPNPSSGKITVSFDKFFSGNISVLDCNGKTIIQKKVKNTQIELNLKNFPAGTYFIVANDGAKKASKKFVLE